MANIKSSKKDVLKSRKNYLHNKPIKTKVRTYMKKAEAALLASDATRESVFAAIREFESNAMKAAKRNIVKKLAVSRKISRLVLKMKAKFGQN